MSVLEAKSCGAETVPELVTSPHTTLPVDTPPLVAVKVQSRLSQSSGPAEAAPAMVSVAPVSAPVAAKLVAVAAPEAVNVPVDTSPTLEGAGPDLHAVQVQRARRLLHQPGDRAAEGCEVIQRGGAEKSRRAVLQTPCEGVPRKVPVTPT